MQLNIINQELLNLIKNIKMYIKHFKLNIATFHNNYIIIKVYRMATALQIFI